MPANLARIEDALRRLTGQGWSVRLETVSAPPEPAALPAAPVAAPRPRRNDREEAEKEPLVKRARDVLGAQVVFAEQDFGQPPAEPAPRPTADRAAVTNEEP